MAEKIVIFRDNQELQAEDFLNQQQWMQDAVDHLVNDAIIVTRGYWGFNVTKAAATTLKTTQGRLYGTGGAVYAREDEVSIDLYNQLPVTARKWFAVVVWGQSVDEDIQPRNYLIDADTGMAEPQSVAMQRTRYCNVSTVAGTESADPQQPSVGDTYTAVGYVLCDPAGIISVQQSTFNQLDNLALVAAGLRSLIAWRGYIEGQIATLRTDLANLARQLLLYTPLSEFQKLVDLVNQLWELVHKAGATVYYGTDRFLDESQSDTLLNVDGQYNARVDEGLRFPGASASWIGQLQLLNPSEPVVVSYSGFLLPRPSGSRVRYDCSFPGRSYVSVRLLSFGYNTFTCRQLSPARWRYRCGPHFTPSPPGQVWSYEANRDPANEILRFTAEAPWTAANWGNTVQHNEVGTVYYPRIGWDRWNRYWRDWVDVHYWAKVYSDFSHTGNHGAQSWYNAQDGWLTGITLFSHKDFHQPLTLVITQCNEDGTPDYANATLRRVVLSADDVATCYGAPINAGDILVTAEGSYSQLYLSVAEGGLRPLSGINIPGYEVADMVRPLELVYPMTPGQNLAGEDVLWRATYQVPSTVFPVRINFPPVFCQAGRHVAYHVHSTFDHEFSFCDADDAYQVHQGAFWRHDGTRFTRWGPGPRTMRFLAHYATWGRWGGQQSPGGQLNYEINMQPLQLAAGIGSVDVLAEAIVPAATDLNFALSIGGQWRKFDHDFSYFTGSDALIPFRVEMCGTTDLMPGISLPNSELEVLRGTAASPTFHHISKPITLGTASTSIKVVIRMKDFVAANHTCLISLHYGATNNTSPSVVDDVMDDGTWLRKATFTTTSITSFVVKIDGTSNGVGVPFVVLERIIFV